MRKLYVSVVTSLGIMAVFAGSAFALPGDPPTFDASTLTPKLNDFAVSLLAGLVILIGAVLVIKVPFAIVNIAMRTVRRVFGSSKPSAT